MTRAVHFGVMYLHYLQAICGNMVMRLRRKSCKGGGSSCDFYFLTRRATGIGQPRVTTLETHTIRTTACLVWMQLLEVSQGTTGGTCLPGALWLQCYMPSCIGLVQCIVLLT
jgi:hypothetical protein